MRLLARTYAVLLVAAVAWAWWTDLSMFGSKVEHLLPDVVLAFITLPSSLLISPLYEADPGRLNLPFAQLGLLTCFALLQGLVVWWLSERHARARSSSSAA
jgi:hypothetical protein